MDETYVKVKGKWKYLYRAIDNRGKTIDFYLSSTRNTVAAKRFLAKCLKNLKAYEHPRVINTDQNAAYDGAIKELIEDGKLPSVTQHRKVKYLNNQIESDHRRLKRLINPVLGFHSMRKANATIKGFEVMRMIKKQQLRMWPGLPETLKEKLAGENHLIER